MADDDRRQQPGQVDGREVGGEEDRVQRRGQGGAQPPAVGRPQDGEGAHHGGDVVRGPAAYHFAGKDELVLAVMQHVVAGITASVGARVRAEETATGQLRAFIEGTVAYADEQRAPMSALLTILLAGALPQGAGADDPVPHHLVAQLHHGQVDGEFHPRVRAMAVQRSVESVSFLLQSDPDLDCAAFGRELATLFDLATRRPS